MKNSYKVQHLDVDSEENSDISGDKKRKKPLPSTSPDKYEDLDHSDHDDHHNDDADGEPLDLDAMKGESRLEALKSFRFRKPSFLKKIQKWLRTYFTYANLKAATRWLTDSAKVNFSISFEDIMMAMTLFVLFADNIKLIAFNKYSDSTFETANAVCLFFFIFEFFANSWSKTEFTILNKTPYLAVEGYVFSFFWNLDLLAIISMFPDIDFIAEPLGMGNISNSVSGSGNYTKAGRGVRLGRVVRLVRLYKIASERAKRRQQEEELLELVRVGVIEYDEVEKARALYNDTQSRLGIRLSETITRRVIVLVLVMLIVLPLLAVNEDDYSGNVGLNLLHDANINPSLSLDAKQLTIDTLLYYFKTTYSHDAIVYLSLTPFQGSPIVSMDHLLDVLRPSALVEHEKVTHVNGVEYRTKMIINQNEIIHQSSVFSIIMTLFVGFMLITGSVIISSDAQKLVIEPIERMMNLVDAVAKNPLQAFQLTDGAEYEMKLLEGTIQKITGLLRVGFGEAGAGIISANLQAGDGNASINPLLPGIRVYAIVGFCDIHHFEDVNHRLGNDVLVFVNQIAEIVHSRVAAWAGQCNKNLGNAFVIIWRIGDEDTLQELAGNSKLRNTSSTRTSMNKGRVERRGSTSGDAKSKTVDLRRVPGVDTLADKALIGYLKIIAEINRDKKLLSYRKEARLTLQGAEAFKVSMGFGLHAGWAIEGAVGSKQKVDATYLSPHVNMAARLETSSRQYGVPLLASQNFYDLLSPTGQDCCRRLDVVTVKGSEVPIGIYTYDCLQDQEFKTESTNVPAAVVIEPEMSRERIESIASDGELSAPVSANVSLKVDSKPSAAIIENKLVEIEHGNTGGEDEWLSPQEETSDIFERDYDLLRLRTHINAQFLNTFQEGINFYLSGDWFEAKSKLERANDMMSSGPYGSILQGDGPCKTILKYMSERYFKPDASWKGFRPLTSK